MEGIQDTQYDRILQQISQAGNHYIVIGDFNAITSITEKEGGRMMFAESIGCFNNFIIRGSLVDLWFVGY